MTEDSEFEGMYLKPLVPKDETHPENTYREKKRFLPILSNESLMKAARGRRPRRR